MKLLYFFNIFTLFVSAALLAGQDITHIQHIKNKKDLCRITAGCYSGQQGEIIAVKHMTLEDIKKDDGCYDVMLKRFATLSTKDKVNIACVLNQTSRRELYDNLPENLKENPVYLIKLKDGKSKLFEKEQLETINIVEEQAP